MTFPQYPQYPQRPQQPHPQQNPQQPSQYQQQPQYPQPQANPYELWLRRVKSVFSRIGGDALLYRSMFLEEINKDYVRTARSKGLSETAVLFKHVLRNASLPIITSTVAVLPMLFLGSLIMESFFGIPGLGSFTIDAINAQDFAIVRTMVFVGTVLYVIGLILTDVAYTIADPRIRLK